MDLHRFYRCAMVFLDVLEELGRCAALDFVIRCFFSRISFLSRNSRNARNFFYSRTRCLTLSNALDGMHGNLSLRDGFLFEEGAVAPMGEWHHGVGGLGEVGDELLGVVE